MDRKFNTKKLEKLNSPERLKMVPPDFIWNKLNPKDCRILVDIGAGTGLFSRAFYNLIENRTIYAADISNEMIKWMQDNIVKDFPDIIPMLMNENKISLEDDFADCVIMIALYHELISPEKMLTEVNRILKKGGKICIIDWKKEERPFGPPFDICYNIKKIIKQLESADFNKIQSDESLEMFNMVWAEK